MIAVEVIGVAAADTASAEWIDTRAVAALVGVTPWTLLQRARTGGYPPGMVAWVGRQVRWDAARVRAWLAAGGDGPGYVPAGGGGPAVATRRARRI